jgi:hypothetical protein
VATAISTHFSVVCGVIKKKRILGVIKARLGASRNRIEQFEGGVGRLTGASKDPG